MTGRASHRTPMETVKDEQEPREGEANGYMRVLMRPIQEHSHYKALLDWITQAHSQLTSQQLAWAYGAGGLSMMVLVYQLVMRDLGYIFHRFCALLIPIFSIICSFYWVALYFRKSWSTTSVYVLFCACFAGEFLTQCICDIERDNYISQPLLSFGVLLAVSGVSLFSTLETVHSTGIIAFISFIRFLACTMLTDLPQVLRPFLAYFSGIVGVIFAKYMETVFKAPVSNPNTSDGKIPVIKRRRSSSSTVHNFSTHRSGRRTSLPALTQKNQTPTSSYESAIIGEAHGLISDMLADSSLPPHIVSGLRSVSNLLKPPENHAPSHKPKVSPLVSLTEATNYGSDSEDLPYTGERPSSLPKRLRRSLPPSLIRRMSTSTWTTTTSATGMPTLELEPCRTRSSSFRHSRESTPGSSPTGSRSNSPSPSSPTTISLTIPKSRSFSATSIGAHAGTAAAQKRPQRERKGYYLANPAPTDNATGTTPSPVNKIDKCLSPLNKAEAEIKELGGSAKALTSPVTKDLQTSLLSKRLNITSDYESSDSPSSSDHSDNVNAAEDTRPLKLNKTELVYHNDSIRERDEEPEPDGVDGAETKVETKALILKSDIEHYDSSACLTDKERSQLIMPFNPEELKNFELLDTQHLSIWDYPIFDLAEQTQDTILSRVAYKLFQETGLFETFRIPLPEFLTYFHELELGYREKPYHNRIHATDVLHGVYYLTTQAIPGFQYVNPEGDVFQKLCSSNTDSGERQRIRSCCRPSFTADDTYGILGGNFPPLELMALFTAAAMHDYDHPGRTNAFLVTTHAPLAVLYNDRSVLENHHAASVWRLFMSSPRFNWLIHLDKAEFKRFRFLIVEAILATDLKRHFEILAEFNAKVNDDDAPGIDWTMEPDRLMVANMIIKMADINGPCKKRDLHFSWTEKISEEFYEQGDEESNLGLTISPYMNRKHPQLAKLQESFINHLVAPLCNAIAAAGLLPGTWVDDESDTEGLSDTDKEECKDTDDEEIECEIADKDHKYCGKKIHCFLTKNIKNNHDMWVAVLKHEEAQKGRETTIEDLRKSRLSEKSEMETIKEEDTPPNSAASTKDDGSPYSSALQRAISSQREALAAQARKHSPPAVLNYSDSQAAAPECCSSSGLSTLPSPSSCSSSHPADSQSSCSENTLQRLSPRLQVTDASDV